MMPKKCSGMQKSYLWTTSKYLSMLEKQIWNHKLPQFWFTNFGQYSGLFGLYGLEGQTNGIAQIINPTWL